MGDRLAQLWIEIKADASAAIKSLVGLKAGLKDTEKAATGMGAVMNSLVKAGAITTLVAGFKKIIDTTINYEKEIKRVAILSGMNYQETARLVAISGDLGINTEDLIVGFKKLSSEGHAPTIATLMQLSDEYLLLQTQEERNRFANDHLGKSYDRLLPLLKLGSEGIAAAAKNVNEGLIPSNADIAVLDDYTKSLNEFNDAKLVAIKSVGKAFLPGLTALTGGIADIFNAKSMEDVALALFKANIKFFQLQDNLPNLIAILIAAGYNIEDFGFKAEDAATKTGKVGIDVSNVLVPALRNVDNAAKVNTKSIGVLGKNFKDAGNAGERGAGMVMRFKDSVNESRWSAESAKGPLEEVKGLITNQSATWSVRVRINGMPAGSDLIHGLIAKRMYGNKDWLAEIEGKAGGGNLSGPALVGERGPELFFPGMSGQVISNEDILRALSEVGRKTTTNNFGLTLNGMGMSADQAIGSYAVFESLRH